LAKAKALRIYVEPLITRSKEDTTHSRRTVFSYLRSKEAVTELFRVISVKVAGRPGGYTRIIKLDNRLGDNAEMCMMELVDFNENLLTEKSTTTAKSTRRRRGSKKKASDTPVATEAPSVNEEVDVKAEVKEDVKVEAKEEVKKEEPKQSEEKKVDTPKPEAKEKKTKKPDSEEKK